MCHWGHAEYGQAMVGVCPYRIQRGQGMSFMQVGGMFMAEYQSRFFMHERFAPGSFASIAERAA